MSALALPLFLGGLMLWGLLQGLDVFAALPVCLVAEAIIFGRSYWLPRFRKEKTAD